MVTIIGRGHSGTRAMSHTLSASNVYMGEPLNESGDLLPPEDMYEAARIIAKYVEWKGGLKWDFKRLHSMPIPDEFKSLINSYLRKVLNSQAENKGWKIPETTLVYPWIRRLFPDIKYIFWIRNPRDCIVRGHITDNMKNFGIPFPESDDIRFMRAVSWKYQYDLIRSTPKAKHWIEIRFEDFVLRQEQTLKKLEKFLGIHLAKIKVKPEAVERWKQETGTNYYDFFKPAMKKHNYKIPPLRMSYSIVNKK